MLLVAGQAFNHILTEPYCIETATFTLGHLVSLNKAYFIVCVLCVDVLVVLLPQPGESVSLTCSREMSRGLMT